MAATEQAELEHRDALVFLDDLMDLNNSYEAYKEVDLLVGTVVKKHKANGLIVGK